MKKAVKQFARDPFRQDVWDRLAAGMRYVGTEFADEEGEDRVGRVLEEVDAERGTGGNRLYYLAVPPQAFTAAVTEIGERRAKEGWVRLIVEKPFGHDLASARELNDLLHRWFREDEVFRIDHYLGKETVQNMLALRFANGIFEPIWNRQFIDHVQITVAESMGIEGRAGFYESAGAIRDIFQNHLLQLLALTAMEPPIDFTADSVRNEKVKVLKSMHTPGPKSVVRGQYGAGFVEGIEVPGYREEDGVAPGSLTETYIAAKLYVDNWRWADTPFYVRAGKRLARRETTIAIQFQRAPHPPFEEIAGDGLRPNVLLIHVQPDEGVSLAIGAKVPGAGMTIRTVHMDFLYGGAFRTGLPEAYERLILDAMLGDATLFTREDEVEEQWKLVDAINGAWQRDRPNFPNYASGTWGPAAADDLIHRDAALLAPPLGGADGRRLRHRAPAGAPAGARGRRRHARPPHEHDDAHRLVPARVAPEGARDPRRPARAPSRPHDLPDPVPGQRGEDRHARGAEGLPAPGRLARGALRGDRAPAAGLRRPPPGLDRAAAARLRPARVLPLARRARLGERALSPRSSASPTGSSSTRRSGATSRRPTRCLEELFDSVAVSDIAFSRTLPWRRRLAELWPGIGEDREAARRGPARRRGARRRLAPLAAEARHRADAAERSRGDGRCGSTASPSSRRASCSTGASCSRPSSISSAATPSTRLRSEPSSRAREVAASPCAEQQLGGGREAGAPGRRTS